MATIITRETGATAKGSPLLNAEVDQNFINLNESKLELGGTYSGGTAGGVTYLNDSKVLTSGSAMQFDGTTLAAPVLSVSSGIFEYANTVSANYSIAAGRNALSIGPIISINPGITVTVASESAWSITN